MFACVNWLSTAAPAPVRWRQIEQHIARPIAAIVVLNNVFNIVGSVAVGGIAASVFGARWVGAVSGVLTFLIILFAEIAPKALGERYAEQVALAVAVPVRWLTAVMTPLVVVIETSMRPLTRGHRLPTTNEAEIRLLAGSGPCTPGSWWRTETSTASSVSP